MILSAIAHIFSALLELIRISRMSDQVVLCEMILLAKSDYAARVASCNRTNTERRV